MSVQIGTVYGAELPLKMGLLSIVLAPYKLLQSVGKRDSVGPNGTLYQIPGNFRTAMWEPHCPHIL